MEAIRTVAATLRDLIGDADRRRMRADVVAALDLVPERVNRLTVSEWAERHRILPQGLTPIPGPFDFGVTPYLREIADCLSESSDIERVAVMKGAQLGFTVGVLENFIGYIIDVAPGPALFVSADKGVAETSIELRVDRMIESAGLSGKIFAQTEKRAHKKTGDTKAKKEFPGGFLLAAGPNTGSKLRSFSVRYLLLDEPDAYPQEVGTSEQTQSSTRRSVNKRAAEGDPIALAEKRTDTFEAIRKILYGSTPLIKQTSRILKLFDDGDQRYYYVPCKHCGHMQRLRWRDDEGKYRLKFEKDAEGRLVYDLDKDGKPIPGTGHAWYECEACSGHWKNEDKAWFLPRGEWRPTKTASKPRYRSYHLSALYSPVGMHSWEAVAQEWIDIGDPPDLTRLRTFINLTLGECYEERGEAPRFELILTHREQYRAGELPQTARPLIITLGADVQKDRIECEVVAWGKDKESWSISYLTLPGDTDDINGDAWTALYKAITEKHAGHPIDMALIDSGYNSPIVYHFCQQFLGGVYPVRGDANFAADRGTRRVLAIRDVPGYHTKRVDLDTDHLKLEIYNCINRSTHDGRVPSKPFAGYCHFPIDYSRRYAEMMTAEQRMHRTDSNGRGRMVWVQHGRNEALDCRAYALAGIYVLYYRRVEQLDQWYREKKMKDPPEYTWIDFWKEIEVEKIKK